MTSLTDLLSQGAAHAWLFVPTAILLGALHGLEPGHSKTMMAAFIIAVRGTVRQAVLLGLCATLSHTAIVWVIALGGLYLWRGLAPDTIEPYLQVASAIIIIAMGAWMLWRARREQALSALHDHGHDHDHEHGHGTSTRIDTGHGILRLDVFEDGVPPRFRLTAERGHGWRAEDITLETERPDGTRQTFDVDSSSGQGFWNRARRFPSRTSSSRVSASRMAAIRTITTWPWSNTVTGMTTMTTMIICMKGCAAST